MDFKRHNVNYAEREFHKVDASIVPPIISEELFEQCQKALEKRKIFTEATTKTNGRKKASKDVFAKKMTCACGSGFKRFKWNTTKDGNIRYGYTCYNIVNHHPQSYYEENDIDTTGLNLCNMPSFSDLKMRIQAKLIFDNLLNFDELFSDVLENIKKENNTNKSNFEEEIHLLEVQKATEQEKQDSLTEKYIDGKITDDIYQRAIEKSKMKISKIELELSKKNNEKQNFKAPDLNIKQISETLKKVLDTSIDVNDELIDRFVFQIIVKSPTEYEWRLHFKEINSLTPNFVELMSLTADVNYAKKYSKDNHRLFKQSLWEPIDIKVMVAI